MPTKPAQLRAEGHSALGNVILRDTGIIVDRWARRAVDEQLPGRRVHHDVLLDHLPTLLWELGRGLADIGSNDALRHRRPAVVHGDQRWEAGWSIEEVVRDYQLLRIILVQHLDDTLRRPLATRESMALGVFIDDAIAASVAAYQACQEGSTPTALGSASGSGPNLDEMFGVMGILGHEIRNPLAPIRNALQVLELAGDNAEPRERARLVIERQLGVITRLVEDLLDVPRLVRGKMPLKTSRVDLALLLREAVEDRRAAFDAAGVTLTSDIPLQPVWTSGDIERLTQVVGNLFANALKFTDRRGAVDVRLNVDAARQVAIASVADTGIGIEPALLPKVFGAFVQADRAVERSRGGLGLGLAMVKGLVELHGGTVRAESKGVGKGSTFTVELPLIDLPKRASVGAKRKSRAASRRVLIVEDNRDAAESLKMYLELLGHQVTVAFTGLEGIEQARVLGPDVVFLDIGLPGMSGYVACTEMRKDPALAETLFVAVSGHAAPDPTAPASECFDLHLLKPVDPSRFAEVVADHKMGS